MEFHSVNTAAPIEACRLNLTAFILLDIAFHPAGSLMALQCSVIAIFNIKKCRIEFSNKIPKLYMVCLVLQEKTQL